MAHGTRKIAFNNPLEGQITITAQVLPIELYAMYSDGIIDTSAKYYMSETITCATAGELPLTVSSGTIVAGSVFVYKEGEYGKTPIAGTYASNKFTAETAADLVATNKYEVGFMVSRSTGVQQVTLNNNRVPKDVIITMDTFDKDEAGNWVPIRINVLKATIQRNLDLSFSSEGDPQEVTMTFDILEKDKDNFVEYIELTEEVTVNPSQS
jgi:Ca2+-binding EF-hand superfamily protein